MNKAYFSIMLLFTLLCNNLYAAELTDPTRPASAHTPIHAANAPEPLHVDAIMSSSLRYWAIVNGTVVHVGDHIASALIEEITHEAVHYSRGGHSEVALLARSTLQVRHNETSHEE